MKNSGIRIETSREVNDKNEEGFRIADFDALPKKDLPAQYLEIGPSVYFYEHNPGKKILRCTLNGKGYFVADRCNLVVNSFYVTKDMVKILNHIKTAGQNLAEVNAELAKKRAAWNGKITFVDGVKQEVPRKSPDEIQDKPIELAKRIAELWGAGRLLYWTKGGHIKPLKI